MAYTLKEFPNMHDPKIPDPTTHCPVAASTALSAPALPFSGKPGSSSSSLKGKA